MVGMVPIRAGARRRADRVPPAGTTSIVGEVESTYASGEQRVSASVDSELVAEVCSPVSEGRAAGICTWVDDAMCPRADHDRLLLSLHDLLSAYEPEHGEISEGEMREASRRARARAIVAAGRPDNEPSARSERGRGAAKARKARWRTASASGNSEASTAGQLDGPITVTRVPMGVSGQSVWASATDISTQPLLWGEP